MQSSNNNVINSIKDIEKSRSAINNEDNIESGNSFNSNEIFLYDFKCDRSDIFLFGYMPVNGRYEKIKIQLCDYDIYMDVQVNYKIVNSSKKWEYLIQELKYMGKSYENVEKEYSVKQILKKVEPIQKKIFKGFHKEETVSHLRCHFKNFWDYERFQKVTSKINDQYKMYLQGTDKSQTENVGLFMVAKSKKINDHLIKTSEDDTVMNYICKIQREHKISIAGWNSVTFDNSYELGRLQKNNNIYEMKVPLKCIKMIDIDTDFQQRKFQLPVMTWDIEVSMKEGIFSIDAFDPMNNIICIGCSYVDADDTVKKITISYLKCKTAQENILVLVKDEKEMLLEFARCIMWLNPAIITGFNDFHFDWKFLKDRLKFFKIENEFAQILNIKADNYMFRPIKIKVSAGNYKEGVSLSVPGILFVDTRVQLMKVQDLDKKSLNDYLRANDLPLKYDVSFEAMNRSFRRYQNNKIIEEDIGIMGHVFDYCVNDAHSCYELWRKRNLLTSCQEISQLSYTPLIYAFNNGVRIKVLNMVAEFAGNLGFSVPMTNDSGCIRWDQVDMLSKHGGKYQGAFVLQPNRGLHILPVGELDFSSLYPSLMIAFNLSPENVIYDTLIGSEYDLNKISETVHIDVHGEEFYQPIIKQEYRIGIYPQILKHLYAKRKAVQKEMESYDEHSYKYSLLQAKQGAIKVLMNSFYGEGGRSTSPLFDLVVSAGTTTYGRKFIKIAHDIIKSQGADVVYGDTDSAYICPKLETYKISDQTILGDLLNQSFDTIMNIKELVNEEIGNATRGVLKMEFGKIMCPSLFICKKQYCGIQFKKQQHNYEAVEQDVLIKGISLIKSDRCQAVREEGLKMVFKILSRYATYKDFVKNMVFDSQFLRENLQNVLLKDLYDFGQKLDTMTPDQYGMLCVNKKAKKDAKGGEMANFMQRFVDCIDDVQSIDIEKSIENRYKISKKELQELGIQPPEYGESIEVIYVDMGEKAKSADKLHLLQYAVQKGLRIDKATYMKHYRTSIDSLMRSCLEAEDECSVEVEKKQVNKIIQAYLKENGDSQDDYKVPDRIVQSDNFYDNGIQQDVFQ